MTAVGDRVELLRCTDPHTKLEPGDRGTVTLVNTSSFGTTVFVDWDSGSKLGLVMGEDSWKVVLSESEERVVAIREDGSYRVEPDEDAYDPTDPKHPTYHERMADAWDMREGK